MACPREVVLDALHQLAPTHLAESWDNVGLLVDPGERTEFERAFITIDLSDTTLEEALSSKADFIVAYHPPIFSGLKRLRWDQPAERIILRALREGLTIYSPHTALDAVPDGMGDWLARAVGPGRIKPIVPHESDSAAGSGRTIRLDRAISIDVAISMVKSHLGLSTLRTSRAGTELPITNVGVCPGAGGAVFEHLKRVDLLITGEMRHHDVLNFRARGTHVILTEHTNTERGYLPYLAQDLRKTCPGLEVLLSQLDADPLEIA